MSEVPEMTTNSPAEKVATMAKDAAYIAIGLGVLAVQELQVRRHEIARWFSGQTGRLAGAVDEAKGTIDGLQGKIDGLQGTIDGLQGKIEDGVKTVEERLSALADQAVDAATSARTELFDRFGLDRFGLGPAKPAKATKSAGETKAA
jgi:hypothetical protein